MEGQAGYENEAMEELLREALKLRCTRIDVFYMIGLQHQTYESVMETVDYCEHLFRFGDKRLQAFISPMGPFLDPGSQIFEDPEASATASSRTPSRSTASCWCSRAGSTSSTTRPSG
jgi:hypothetical protein